MADHRHPNAAVSPESSPTSESESGGHYNNGGLQDSIREQDRFLPIANVGRIMKRALPGNAKISKDAKETVQECVSEFISFITGEASDKCQREKRKTINGDDLLWGMTTLGFQDYVEPLKIYLHKYRELEGERSYVARQGEQHQRQLKESPTASHGSGNDPSGPNRQASYAYSPHGPMLYDPQHRPLAMAYHMAVQAPGAGSGAGPADRGR